MHMLAQEAAASDDGTAQAQKFCDITIVDLNNLEIPIKVSLKHPHPRQPLIHGRPLHPLGEIVPYVPMALFLLI